MRGAKETGVATTLLVGVKITTILLFVIIGAFAVTGSNYEPFVPPNTGDFRSFGWTGVFAAAAIVFYSFISFDAVCTAAQEAKNPRRTVPIGVLGSLGIATVLYVIVGVVLVGLVPYYTLNVSNPLSAALEGAGISWLATVVDVGATIGLAASVMALLYSQTRILMRMSEDGMLPKLFRKVDAVRRTPGPNTVICGIACIIMTGFLPLSILTKLISIGTLLAFIIVSASVLVLRRTRPDLNRPFKVPFGPVIPILAIVVSLAIMATLELDTWLRLIVWLLVGLVVYFGYSKRGAERVIMERAARRDAGLPVPPAVPDH